jgi:putative transposase
MPGKQTTPMTERFTVIALYHTRLWTMTELCTRVGISRKTGDKWRGRSLQEGLAGLREKPHIPRHCPPRSAPDIAAVLVAAKRLHPPWGPRQSFPDVARHSPALGLPAASSPGALFRTAGLSRPKQRRRRPRHPGAPALHTRAPNAGWAADFQGQGRPGDGLYGYPRTGADAASRDLLGCSARLSTQPGEAQPSSERLFREDGLPGAMRPAHGAPCAPPAFGGLSTLSVWWITLGSRHQRIEPGRPAQNGRPERLHRPLKAAATRPPERNQAAQQARFARCRREYNPERPHAAVGQRPPRRSIARRPDEGQPRARSPRPRGLISCGVAGTPAPSASRVARASSVTPCGRNRARSQRPAMALGRSLSMMCSRRAWTNVLSR